MQYRYIRPPLKKHNALHIGKKKPHTIQGSHSLIGVKFQYFSCTKLNTQDVLAMPIWALEPETLTVIIPALQNPDIADI